MGIKHRADSGFCKFSALSKLGFGRTNKCFEMPYVSYPRLVLNLTMKKGILIFIVFFLVGFLVLYILPIEVTHSRELKRGNILIENIENYVNETGKIPESHNWETLRSLGFMEDEMETAYPEIRQINDSTYELIFTIGFDPPYLMWNSQERIWKDDFPTIPDEWKNKN
jgi:hypothetical protein